VPMLEYVGRRGGTGWAPDGSLAPAQRLSSIAGPFPRPPWPTPASAVGLAARLITPDLHSIGEDEGGSRWARGGCACGPQPKPPARP